MRKDRFTDEAMAAARALADLKYSENAEVQQAFAEAYDFARCRRPDGSTYPIAAGKQCRRGTKTSDAEPAKKKSTAERMAAAYDKRKKEGSFVPKKEKKKPEAAVKPAGKKFKTDFRKEVEEAAEKRRKKEAEIVANQQRLARGKKFIMKARQGMKRLEAQYRMAVGRPGGNPGKIMDAMKRLRKQTEKVGAEMEKLMSSAQGKGQFYVP